MQRVQLTRGVVLGPGKEDGVEGDIISVEPHFAWILINNRQARVVEEPETPVDPKVEKPKAADEKAKP